MKKTFTKTKILPKAEESIVQFFYIRIWKEKTFAKTKILSKAAEMNLSILLELELEQEKAFTKTKILPKA